MYNESSITKEESFKARALQILNLRYIIRSDLESAYKRKTFEQHPDMHPEIKTNPTKVKEYENKTKVITQAYELLINTLENKQLDFGKYILLEDTNLLQSLLPKGIKPIPLGKTAQEIWIEKWGNMV